MVGSRKPPTTPLKFASRSRLEHPSYRRGRRRRGGGGGERMVVKNSGFPAVAGPGLPELLWGIYLCSGEIIRPGQLWNCVEGRRTIFTQLPGQQIGQRPRMPKHWRNEIKIGRYWKTHFATRFKAAP